LDQKLAPLTSFPFLDRHLEVTGIIPDGPVAKSGKIRIGDTLRRVNGKEVRAEESLPLGIFLPQSTHQHSSCIFAL
jgi:S1-C subfamily serine protease